MEYNKKSISSLDEQISHDGIIILDNISSLPFYDEPYLFPYFLIGVIHQGCIDIEYDGYPFTLSAHDIAVTHPQHVVVGKKVSDNFNASVFIVSRELLKAASDLSVAKDRFFYERMPHFKLTDEQHKEFLIIMETMRIFLRRLKDMPLEMFHTGILHLLIFIIRSFYSDESPVEKMENGDISRQLFEALSKHYTDHHDVNFYANLFCLTPKHFSTLVKQETGQSASHWIQQYLISVAKMMIRTDHSATMEEISDKLGFTEISAFSRFFRRHTGMSPSQYRQLFQKQKKA